MATDYYERLGVEPGAGPDEIARAFRTEALEHHPDRTDDADSRERFKALSAAYGVLGNPQRRARYDELRAAPRLDVAGAGPLETDFASDQLQPDVLMVDVEANRPLSVRALPERRHGRWASVGGIVLIVAGVLAAGLVIWLVGADSGGTARNVNGSDPTGRNVTLGLVALKLIVVGIVFVVLGNRRRRYP
jgi:hypothetical protein